MAVVTPVPAACCPACGSVDRRAASAVRQVCRTCGHADAAAAVTSGVVVNEVADASASARPTRLQRAQVRLAAAARPGGGPVIDVGCANGGFLAHARTVGEAGVGSYGVEVSAPNAAVARARGLDVRDRLEEVEPGALVTFWHSAEHLTVPELVELLEEVAGRSAGRATALISVPNGGSLQRRWFEDRWAYRDDLAHRSEFTAGSLGAVLARAGWAPRRWFRTPVYGLFGAAQSSLNLVRPRNELYEAAKRGNGTLGPRERRATVVAALVTAPVAGLVSLAEVDRRRGAVLTVAAVPEGRP